MAEVVTWFEVGVKGMSGEDKDCVSDAGLNMFITVLEREENKDAEG